MKATDTPQADPNQAAKAAAKTAAGPAARPARRPARKPATLAASDAKKPAPKPARRARKPAAPAATAQPGAALTASAAVKPALVAPPAPARSSKTPKPKLKPVRDSFTMPQMDFDLVDQLKQRALGFKRPAKKSELLRAGLHALQALSDTRLRAALDALVPLKPGRPKKSA